MSGWHPIIDDRPNEFDERLKDYHFQPSWAHILAFWIPVILAVALLLAGLRAGWRRAIHIPPVSTPVAVWTRTAP